MLPTEPQVRAGRDPRSVNVLLAGLPKVGKTTMLANWSPTRTLIIDTQGGSLFLPGEHYVAHVETWDGFVALVDDLLQTEHDYLTVGIDLVDDIWRFCDEAHAGKGQVLASATDDYQRALKTARGVFMLQVGRLLRSNLGVWFLSHAAERRDGELVRYESTIADKDVRKYINGACDCIFLAEKLGPNRVLHTAPSARFEAGTRDIPLPEPMPMDAPALFEAMRAHLSPAKTKTPKPEKQEAIA